jgi:hypothetical protein
VTSLTVCPSTNREENLQVPVSKLEFEELFEVAVEVGALSFVAWLKI